MLAPGSNILKVSPTTSTIKQPGKPMVTVRNSDIARFGTLQESKTPLIVYAECRVPRMGQKLVEEDIRSHKQFTRKIKENKKMEHRKREPGSGVLFTKSNISRAMRGRIPKVPTFLALRNQQQDESAISHSEQQTCLQPTSSAMANPTIQA